MMKIVTAVLGLLLFSVSGASAQQNLINLTDPPASRIGASCLWAQLVEIELGSKRCGQSTAPNEAAIHQAISELQTFWTDGGEGAMVPETALHYLQIWSKRWSDYSPVELEALCPTINGLQNVFTADRLDLVVERLVVSPAKNPMACL